MTLIIELFIRFLQVGLFSIGGGYATLPLIHQQVIEFSGWLTQSEFTDIITISQMTPGPLAVNASTFVGMRIAGLSGAVIATFGCILPGIISSSVLHRFFRKSASPVAADALKALRSASAGLIASAAGTILLLALFNGERMALANLNQWSLLIVISCFVLLRRYQPNTLIIIVLSGMMGVVLFL